MIIRETTLRAGAWLALATSLGCFLPVTVLVRGADFVCVERTFATMQGGHRATSDWVRPFFVPMPMMITGNFETTENFGLATRARLVAIILMNFLLLCAWPRLRESVRRRGTAQIAEAAVEPFAYTARKLFPIARVRRLTDVNFSVFSKYVQNGRSGAGMRGVEQYRTLADRSIRPSGELLGLPSEYRYRRITLFNRELRDHLHTTGL